MGIDKSAIYRAATAGHASVPEDWVSATGLRPLIQDDPCLVWLRWHGAKHGFEQDPKEHSFLEFIGEKGRQFEATWVEKVVGRFGVQSLENDRDVRDALSLKKTLDLLDIGPAVITKAALWWA